ncbi:MAG TPA: aldose epimerase family protein [Acetobacteraceae bacterium]|nr:aldose epimerase family protein [Acetobacteraceae bacterium]
MTKPVLFGTLPGGREVFSHSLRNARGMGVSFIDYGGVITRVMAPDRDGIHGNIVLGMSTVEDYAKKSPYFGALVGRYANRIARGRFTLNGRTYHLPVNNGENSLHGGTDNFSHKLWEVTEKGESAATLRLSSPDGDNGYPGRLDVEVTYTLTEDNALRLDYRAVTDAPTVLNLTNHSYFNLAGEGSGSALDQYVTINADHYTPANHQHIPTGEIAPVEGTPMDFRKLTRIADRIREGVEQLSLAGGYDHNFVLNRSGGLHLAAAAYDPGSGRTLTVETDQPGVQFYTGNKLDGTLMGSGGRLYRQGDGYAFETQHFPDSPNHPEFPSTVLNPGEVFTSTTIWRFGTDR